jgi:hypothetical protein
MANIQLLQNITVEEWKEILAGWEHESDMQEEEEEYDVSVSNTVTSIIQESCQDMVSNHGWVQDDDVTTLLFTKMFDFLETNMTSDDDKEEHHDDEKCNSIHEPAIYLSSFEEVETLTRDTWIQQMEEPLDSVLDTLHITRSILDTLSRQTLRTQNHDHRPSSPIWNENDHVLHCPIHSTNTEQNNKITFLPLAPIEFTCGSFEDPYEYLADIDVAFVFSSCMSPQLMTELGKALGRQCRPGSIIITTEFPLPLQGVVEPLDDDPSMPYGNYQMELVEVLDGYCWIVGGNSTAYIHRVVESLSKRYGNQKRQRPMIPWDEQAYRIIQAYEQKTLANITNFVRNVHNAFIFHGYEF